MLMSIFDNDYDSDIELNSYKNRVLYLKPIMHLARSAHMLQDAPYAVQLEFRIASDDYKKGYVLSGLKDFILNMVAGNHITLGRKLEFDPNEVSFAEGPSRELWEMLKTALMDEISLENQARHTSSYSYSYRRGYGYNDDDKTAFYARYFKLTDTNLNHFMEFMRDEEIEYIVHNYSHYRENKSFGVAVPVNKDLPITVQIKPEKVSSEIILNCDTLHVFGRHGNYVLCGDELYRMKGDKGLLILEISNLFSENDNLIVIPNKHLYEFISKLVPRLEKIAKVQLLGDLEERYLKLPLEAEVFLDYYYHGMAARVVFKYGFEEFNPLIKEALTSGNTERIIVRDVVAEDKIISFLASYGFVDGESERNGWFIQPDEEQAYDFLQDLPELDKIANISCVNLKDFTAPAQSISIGVRINDKSVLELSTKGKRYDFAELVDIFNSYRNKQRYHRLKDGRFMPLGNQQMEKLAGLLELVNKKQLKKDTVEIPFAKFMYVDALGRGDNALQLERDKRFRSVVKSIRNPESSEIDIPESLQDVLREYQTTGVNWLNSLAKLHLGGILADDMGLGKTLQVIAFLEAKKQEAVDGMEPALVVAPTSLVFNWLEEIKKFAPNLRALAIAGTKQEREELLQDISKQDVVITTYNMLVRDMELYSEKFFSYCFIDEAQHIKNPTTQKAQGVKEIQAGGYFALTGTPIENTLTELWSIFDFIMPGYLYGHDKFKRRFETPIVRANDETASEDLYRHISPFILRRLKKDVLSELPEKLERRMLNEMTEHQSKVYDAYFVQAQKELAAELKKNGFEKSRIKILAMLTRLRQIACDPAIFLEDYTGGSGKLDMLEEIVAEAISGGHRILIFSQFTQMLQRIGQRLSQMEVKYYYLDGSTKAQERISLVKNFNENRENTSAFLLSLKAGGTGLNLTGADMVINYDPWWNPAVEDQAADRAYRIGQEKNVQVIKLITKDTIEEQIYELQEKKKALIDKMLQPGESFLSKLSEEEIRNLFM